MDKACRFHEKKEKLRYLQKTLNVSCFDSANRSRSSIKFFNVFFNVFYEDSHVLKGVNPTINSENIDCLLKLLIGYTTNFIEDKLRSCVKNAKNNITMCCRGGVSNNEITKSVGTKSTEREGKCLVYSKRYWNTGTRMNFLVLVQKSGTCYEWNWKHLYG